MNKKNEQLGMNYSTATNQLKKSIMFSFAQRLGLDICFQCGEKIETVDDFTVEHKKPWLDVDPKLFWDLDNIAFSHPSCNSSAGRTWSGITEHLARVRPCKRFNEPEGKGWCGSCRQYLDIDMFTKDSHKINGLQTECRTCRNTRRKQLRKEKKLLL